MAVYSRPYSIAVGGEGGGFPYEIIILAGAGILLLSGAALTMFRSSDR